MLGTLHTIPVAFQVAVATVGAKARSLASFTGRDKFAAPRDRARGVALDDEQWVIVEAETLTEDGSFGGPMTKGEALRSYAAHVREHPRDAVRLEVVSAFVTREAA